VPQNTNATITVGKSRLMVRVVDQNGNAFAGVYVFAYRVVRTGHSTHYYYSGQRGRSDANGTVSLDLDPGTYRILAYNFNYHNYNYRFRYNWSGFIDVPPTSSISITLKR